jgi:uncharacterized protein
MMDLIGRKYEVTQLKKKLNSDKAELIAVIGRRRIGKTFLIRNVYSKQIVFHMTGLHKGRLQEHMERFSTVLYNSYNQEYEIVQPKNWFEAFDLLKEFIKFKKSKEKKVIFLDEFPWLATNKSRFITAFADFWNTFGVWQKDLIVVICGSSASWMIKNVLKSKGSLHNRITDRITLDQFNLYETELFLRKKRIIVSRFEIAQMYMATGGVPYYLDLLDKGESIVQAMDRLFFKKNAVLQLEYDELLSSLFDRSELHQKVIEILVTHPNGLQRTSLVNKGKFGSGGGFTDIVDELIASGFLTKEVPYGKTTYEALYKIKDPYIYFYHKYVKPNLNVNQKIWEKLSMMPTWKSWSGLAFENLCKLHFSQILYKLGIHGMLNKQHIWYHKGNEEMSGAQCDMIIDRYDNVINLCEIKFTQRPFLISKSYANEIEKKITAFSHFNKIRKTIFLTFVSANGLQENIYSKNLVQNLIVLDDLFTSYEN